MKKLIFIPIFLAIAGCASSPQPKPSTPIEQPKRQPPNDGMKQCDITAKLPDGTASSLIIAFDDLLSDFKKCSQKNDNWIQWYNNGNK